MPNQFDDHDVIIRIDQNLTNLIQNFGTHQANFKEHVVDDTRNFMSHDVRIKSLEKTVWMVGGIVLAVNFAIKFFIK